MKVGNRADFALGVGWAAFSLFGLLSLIPAQVGPLFSREALLPTGSLLFMLVLSLALAAKSLRGEAQPAAERREHPPRYRELGAATAVMAGYAFLMETLGFLLTSTIAMTLLFLVFGVRSPRRIAACVISTVAFLYLFFEKALNAPLPTGTLPEALLDLLGR